MTDTNATLSRRERNKQKTQERLLEAARRLFAERDIASTTIDEIADYADVARATFFNYFPGKDAVLQALWLEQLAKLKAVVDEQLAAEHSTQARLLSVLRAFETAATSRPTYLRAVTCELERDAGTLELARHRVDYFQATLAPLVAAGHRQGDVRNDFDGAFLTQMIGAAYLSIVRNWRLDPDYDLRARIEDTARFLGEALRAPGESNAAAPAPRQAQRTRRTPKV
ncbi:TetR/AcrR family transcriptional regulator [Paraburkholderia unamae]|uniref:TetR family transcriptional regulator n=1 Tax=Paraburkholderia unamae TaxID=219649 RepID=A0ABX5KKF7_9BURK|nr:TetR family transcriptional regulator [Paraburkholderia unamae]PVX81160.1 TetR family transcriptional regulator [Paraburkholderia unamae]